MPSMTDRVLRGTLRTPRPWAPLPRDDAMNQKASFRMVDALVRILQSGDTHRHKQSAGQKVRDVLIRIAAAGARPLHISEYLSHSNATALAFMKLRASARCAAVRTTADLRDSNCAAWIPSRD